MAQSLFEELIAIDPYKDIDQTEYVDPKGETGIQDYLLDIIRAPVGGISDAIQGLIQLGALPLDYALDTNMSEKITNFFDEYTPDARTGLGEVVQTLVQFGLPLGVASKVGSGIKVLKGATKINRLDQLSGLGKGVEVARRAGYFGALGGATDIAVSLPAEQSTISETFGLTDKVDIDRLEGKERAAELLKRKFLFGAEGAVIGGGIPMLPVAGTLGAKFLGKAYTTSLGPIGIQKGVNQAFRLLDVPVQKASELIAGKGESSLVRSAVLKGGEIFSKPLKNVPDAKDWKFFDPESGTFFQRLAKKVDNAKNQFTTSGILSPTLKAEGDRVTAKLEGEIKNLARIDKRITNTLYDNIKGIKTSVFDEITNSGVKRNILDAVQVEKNKLFDYLKATKKPGKDGADALFKEINKGVQPYAKQLKQILKESNTRYGNLLGRSSKKSYQNLAQTFVNDADNFFKQRFASFNNSKFKFDLGYDQKLFKKTGEYKFNAKVTQDAFEELKKIIKANRNDLREIFKKGRTGEELQKAIDNNAFQRLNLIKQGVIAAGANPTKFFGNIADIIKKDLGKLQPGETFPDAIKRFLSTPKGQQVEIKDFGSSLLEAVIYNNKQVYKNNYFNLVEQEWKKGGLLFSSRQEAIDKGIASSRLQKIAPRALDGIKPIDVAFESKLFTEGYYALPEISNAILSTKTTFDNFFDNDFYKAIMQFKAGGQIAKTIFSPMTQIRNVTTASFFPLASGLIGKRSSVADAFKTVADDIFTGAKIDIETLNKEIDDLVSRGVIDQNIQVNELRNILNKAKGGKISFESFMQNPTVQKFVDVYQGGDNVWKVYSDRFYQSALREAFGNPQATPNKVIDQVKDWYETVAKTDFIETSGVTGQKKTAEEALKEVSAYLVTNTIPTYSKVPNVIKAIRNLPLGNFIAFPAEIIRTSSNLLTIGARELTSKNPFIRQMGARRLIGASATFGGIGSIVANTAGYVTGVTEEVMEKARRSFVPPYERNATLIPLTSPDENGNFKYFNFSYSNPYDTLFRPINAVLNAVGDGSLRAETVDEIVFNALFGSPDNPGAISEFLDPFITESIGTERIADVTLRQGETRQGKKIYDNRVDDLTVKIARSLEHIIGGLEPGAYRSARRIYEGATGTFSDAGTARNTKDEAIALLSGIRVQEVKPLNSMPFIITSYNKDRNALNRKFASIAYSAGSSPEEIVASYKDHMKKTFDSQKKMYQVLTDGQDLGISKVGLYKQLSDRLTKTSAQKLLTGKFSPPTFSLERFQSLAKRLESENPLAADIYQDAVKTIVKGFDRVKRNINYFDLESGSDEINEELDDVFTDPTLDIRELPTTFAAVNRDDTVPAAVAELPIPQGLDTPVNTSLLNQTVGGNLLGNDILRQIELLKLQGQR